MEEQNSEQHARKGAGDSLQDDQLKELRPAEYVRTINGYLLKGNQRSAFTVAQRAVVIYPEEPILLSYYGSLQALVDRKYRSGTENCAKAIALLARHHSVGKEILYPVLYLNLGRAYVAAGKKKNAVVAFNQGLKFDPEHAALRKEVEKLGTRKKPHLSFLDRANVINKFIGKTLHKKKSRLG